MGLLSLINRCSLNPAPCPLPPPGHISGLISIINAKTGEPAKLRPRCLLRQQTAVVEVTPSRPMCLEEYADYKALGRLALREGGKTIAVGIVTRIVECQPRCSAA